MFNWFTKQEQTVETILSGWLKTITDLEAHAEAKVIEAAKHNALVTFYQNAEALAKAELKKADDVVTKIKALLN